MTMKIIKNPNFSDLNIEGVDFLVDFAIAAVASAIFSADSAAELSFIIMLTNRYR